MSVSAKRIVVTGMGIVSPLGCGVQHVWQSLLAGRSGITKLSEQLVEDIPCKVAGQVPSIERDPLHGFDPLATIPARERKKMDRFIEFALVAAREALTQASPAEQDRTATVIATGIGGFGEIANAVHTTDDRGPRRLSPFTIPSFLANLAAGHVSIAHGFRGPIGAPVTACAAGAQAIGDAARMIRSGEADIALCGGAEAAIHRVSLAGFAAARALSSASNEQPEAASRPFDRDRDGFVMGEGAGLIVIESLEHALARGATPLAELVGYGTSADAYHLTAGPEDGNGARRAMEMAIRQAGVTAEEIDHINAHATSTQVGDKGELAAIKSLFATHPVAITSTKSATGHLLGAAGGIEAIFTIQALRDQIVPPTLNLHHPDEDAEGLNLVALVARPQKMRYALSNGFGFGGVNASLLLKRWE
ncbi:TPA: beta-ketoacyl-ACP synthase II [Raoultella ornithinolytica]|uniref:beta-ketoacyl-ACP synthase II n=1 Tax=Raoultella ornithinolytica TaxID=54291 RepID=UPI00273F73B7|nr:beta-ketoacyl-ACP synthase II [Raoultella ornithinolytica]WLP44249.1 beta-ketoacyl-ACP synthase II [Raoultella ornithinolytica]HEC2549995.1 beta-ketoacyl-ACP synthase II [Raoultella ornithinolytica]HEC2602925.1 beta-ketoacyl-ACP synthase II [Raoultella ornithinolytica]HEC2608436.1 beta-ketoacyl-ACP synthase II [Raoultella ornithinolytica]